MASMVLLSGDEDTSLVVVRRVRLWDRIVARFRAFELDRALANGARPESSTALELRARTLIRSRTRRQLGEAVRRITRQRSRGPSVVRVKASRSAVAAAGDVLDRLATRLLAPAPVDARGVAQVRLLLSDGRGPLFWDRRAKELRPRVRGALEALEPRH